MTKKEAIAWLENRHACGKAMRRVRKCASVRQMIARTPFGDLLWVLLKIGSSRPWGAYLKQKDAAWARYLDGRGSYGLFARERTAIARRVLRAWAASR